ncbi:hypothetical protein GCM10011519_20060 [Marmoricola endophyticus]|uniref:Mycothiol-dependent maleylpyruvate isomerase metal-binding domain-containing protein n=1 Tax=Marmoricola endophyticus TaxID=2040280 RepID=A0A917F5R2_9ACTN|nr:hypothetical protein GCM10011519_20060 [Marmoricola endophyticus]
MLVPTDVAVGLLERAVAHTRGCLALVDDPLLDRPTPCTAWDLRALLTHMDDSLAAIAEAAAGAVSPRPAVPPGVTLPADLLVDRLRVRACDLLAAWARPPASSAVAGAPVDARVLAGAGALEIAVHGWDVAAACGAVVPLPDGLAADLLPLVPALVADVDRPVRFGPPRTASDDSASSRLLALLGR